MTENKRIDMGRFHWDRALEKIIDYETCESYYDDECVEILNDINYQNFKLEKENDELKKENEQLKQELSEYKDFVFSDDKILCYTCLFCTHKGIYEIDCDMKGHVDVHGFCFSYTKKELQE